MARIAAAGILFGLIALGGIGASAALPRQTIPHDAVSGPGGCVASFHVLIEVPSGADLDELIAAAGGTGRWLNPGRTLFAGSADEAADALGGEFLSLDAIGGEAWVLVGQGDAAIAHQLRRSMSEDGIEVWALGDSARPAACPSSD